MIQTLYFPEFFLCHVPVVVLHSQTDTNKNGKCGLATQDYASSVLLDDGEAHYRVYDPWLSHTYI